MVTCVFMDEFQVLLMCKLCIEKRNMHIHEIRENNKKVAKNYENSRRIVHN